RDVNPGPAGSDPGDLRNFNGVLFFTADDGASGRELWASDGSEEGTVLVQDVLPGPGGSAPGWLTVANGLLFFAADDGFHGRELGASSSDGARGGGRSAGPGPRAGRGAAEGRSAVTAAAVLHQALTRGSRAAPPAPPATPLGREQIDRLFAASPAPGADAATA